MLKPTLAYLTESLEENEASGEAWSGSNLPG
jgi:hypothetical protein